MTRLEVGPLDSQKAMPYYFRSDGDGIRRSYYAPAVRRNLALMEMSAHPISNDLQRGHVYVIDDDPDLRETISEVLRSRGYDSTTYDSVAEFFRAYVPRVPSVILVDMRMPFESGLDLLKRVREQSITTPVIFISGESTAPEAVEAMKAGAVDFIFKPASLATILRAIDTALSKHRDASRHQLAEQQFRSRYKSLTPRERELCAFVARGEKIKAIASALGISEPTVKIHKARVLRKIGATSVTELALNLSRFGTDFP